MPDDHLGQREDPGLIVSQTPEQKTEQGDSSYTRPTSHSTAAEIGKEYKHEFTPSSDADKTPTRTSDGAETSGQHVQQCDALADHITPRLLQPDFHHPLEQWLPRRPVRWLLKMLSRSDRNGLTALERIIKSYRNPDAPMFQRIKYAPVHMLIDRMRGKTDVATFRKKLSGHGPTVRGLVIVAQSIAEFGLTIPQKFVAPLFAVWNFTNKCNLSCSHCYQDSEARAIEGELTLEEKLALVDQMGKAHMPMLALSGGEPTISPDLVPILQRAKTYGMHTTIATNGTTMTPERAAELAEAGLRYVEISLDSVNPARHDEFRGHPGMWEKAVAGAKNVVATEGMRLGIAMCVHQGNIDEVPDMIALAEDLGAGCFAHFNFIPVGRGLKMVSGDITPKQREKLLVLLNEKMQKDGIGIISTAPQLGRMCMVGSPIDDGKAACSHAGSGSGIKARVVAKYLGGCGAGRTYVCIEPSGNVTPCVYMPQRVMGNVREKPLMDIFRQSVFWDILNDRDHRLHHCEVCSFKNYCGGCRARADAYFGHLHAGDPGCVFNSKHWDKLVADGIAVEYTSDEDLPPMPHGLA
ncbi:MAG: radical SAM protein [Phycisphaerales bacterium]|nr:radical SAM protein [Phycisphaerales bacterium]